MFPTQPALEHLESRQLLSSVLLNGHGTLRIVGTPAADQIVLSVNADESVGVTLNGEVPPGSPFSTVKLIKVFGRHGNDTIAINESAAPALIPAIVHGGAGDDSITVGDENNLIFGGRGADKITAGNGNNFIRGGPGADDIAVGNGMDLVLGGGGADTIVAGTGNDTLIGGVGADSISGGGGDDVLLGSDGSDTLIGNIGGLSGHDTIYTGLGIDNVVEPGPDDVVNPGGRHRPVHYHDFLSDAKAALELGV